MSIAAPALEESELTPARKPRIGWGDILLLIVIALATFALYARTGGFGFLNYDDPDYVYDNPWVRRGLSADGISWALTTGAASNWHPLTWISLMADVSLFGVRPGPMHLVNAGMHSLSAALLLLALVQMTGRRWAAAWVAGMFAWHPLHVESVAWISERKDVLSTLLWMLCTLAYIHYARQKTAGRYALVLVLLALGLMAKPMLVTLPFVFLLLDFWPLRRLRPRENYDAAAVSELQSIDDGNGSVGGGGGSASNVSDNAGSDSAGSDSAGSDNAGGGSAGSDSFGGDRAGGSGSAGANRAAVFAEATAGRLILEKLPMLALVIASAVATYLAQSAGRSVAAAGGRFTVPIRIENAVLSYGRYLWMTIDPRRLAIVYPHFANLPQRPPMLSLEIGASAVAIVAITLLSIVLRRRKPWVLVGWLWYLGTLVPVIGLVQVGSQGLADRYTYVPLIGIFIGVAWSARSAALHWRWARPVLLILGIGSLVTCAALTWRQIGYWRDGVTVMEHAVEVVPDNYLARTALGEALDSRGQTTAAEQEYRAALAIRPDDPIAHHNLGVQAARGGRIEDAIREYEAAIRADPRYGGTYYNLGKLLETRPGSPEQKARDLSNAESLYQSAARCGDPRGYDALATRLAARGQLDQAIALWEKALALDPSYADAHHGLGVAMLMRGQNQEGLRHLREALSIDPDRPDTLTALAWTLATHPNPAYQNGPEAVRLARRAVELAKEPDAQRLDTLAAALARAGDFDQAAKVASEAAETAERQGNHNFAQAIRKRLQLYRGGRAYTSGQ